MSCCPAGGPSDDGTAGDRQSKKSLQSAVPESEPSVAKKAKIDTTHCNREVCHCADNPSDWDSEAVSVWLWTLLPDQDVTLLRQRIQAAGLTGDTLLAADGLDKVRKACELPEESSRVVSDGLKQLQWMQAAAQAPEPKQGDTSTVATRMQVYCSYSEADIESVARLRSAFSAYRCRSSHFVLDSGSHVSPPIIQRSDCYPSPSLLDAVFVRLDLVSSPSDASRAERAQLMVNSAAICILLSPSSVCDQRCLFYSVLFIDFLNVFLGVNFNFCFEVCGGGHIHEAPELYCVSRTPLPPI